VLRHKKATCILLLLLILSLFSGYILANNPEGLLPIWTGKAKTIASGYLEAHSSRQVHPFSDVPVESSFNTDEFVKMVESEVLELWLNKEMGALRILNKETGYVWGSLPLREAEGLNSTMNCYGNSLVAIQCFGEEGNEKRLSIGKDGEANYHVLDDGLRCDVNFAEVGISFQVEVIVKGNQLTFQMIDESLQEQQHGSKSVLKSVTFMPYLGASLNDSIDGYFLIPDGCGSLIRFQKSANYISTYDARIYGKDMGVATQSTTVGSYIRPEHQVLMPIYGIVHGAYQNGCFAVVEKGEEYASVVASPALRNNPYNHASVRFEYREKYVKNINRKEGAGAYVPQEAMNPVVPRVSFYFLSGKHAHYDAMAVLYREQLLDRGVLSKMEEKNRPLGLQIEILGADKKAGFLFNSTEVFTTAEQAQMILSALNHAGIRNISAVYRNFTKNNECGKKYLAKLGSQKDFRALEQAVECAGDAIFYYVDPVTSNKDQITLRTEAANNLSNMEIKWTGSNPSTLYPFTYLYRLTNASDRFLSANEHLRGKIALAGLSSYLYGDFTSGKELTRKESLCKTLALVDMVANTKKIAMYLPNQYLWAMSDKMFNLPSANSQFLYESDCVPFLQIVLSGCVEPYSEALNTSSFSKQRLLRLVEYGMAPAFTVTDCPSINLYLTAQQNFFSTCFADWRREIVDSYHTVDEALSSSWGESIISHRCISPGVMCTEYENGIRVYVNYTREAKTVEGDVVMPESFLVKGR
jgi:hypothetical protein